MSELRQGTPEWEAMRAGKLTASRFHEAISQVKGGSWGASRATYAGDIIAARLRNGPAPEQTWTTAAIQWGIDTEPQARAAYQFYHDCDVVEIGFIDHPKIEWAGCSPDGLIGGDGMIECKCPNTATHIDTLLGGKLKLAYATQVMWQLACSGRQWCDWVSFDPRLPEEMQLFVQRIHRDDVLIQRLETAAVVFLAEIDARIARLRELRPARAA